MLEFALVAPLLLLLIFGIIDISRIVQAQVTVNNAARQAVRFAITGQRLFDTDGNPIPREDSIKDIARQGLAGLPLTDTDNPNGWGFWQVDVSSGGEEGTAGGPGDTIVVRVSYAVKPLTPIISGMIPSLLLQGYSISINEAWGAVQQFDHANLGPTPLPFPTWTPAPYPTQTYVAGQTATAFAGTAIAHMTQTAIAIPTRTANTAATQTAGVLATQTAAAAATQTALAPTATGTNTSTPSNTPTITNTPTNTHTLTPTSTRTPTPAVTSTPTSTRTHTHTNTPTFTPTSTATRTPTITPTSTRTNTPTRTPSPTRSSTLTVTPTIAPLNVSVVAYMPWGSNNPLDIEAVVTDASGNRVSGATVSVSASNGSQHWSGNLSDAGNGTYRVCNVGSFSGWWFYVSVDATAGKPGYVTGSASSTAQLGNLSSCH